MPIDIAGYFKSITDELMAQRNRVRHFIQLEHLPTDGAWKESVLRAMISKTLPAQYEVASGFVVTEQKASTQIDVLIYDASVPVLYRGGDLVFVPPAACVAIIEVKSRLNATAFRDAAQKLADVSELINAHERDIPLFTGIFAYEGVQGRDEVLLRHIDAVASGRSNRIVNHVSIGADKFIKYWEHGPANAEQFEGRIEDYKTWHHYLLSGMAPGYFLHNLMSVLARGQLVRGNNVWFPSNGKEAHSTATRRLTQG